MVLLFILPIGVLVLVRVLVGVLVGVLAPEGVNLALLRVQVPVLLVLVAVHPADAPPLLAHQQVGRVGSDGARVVR